MTAVVVIEAVVIGLLLILMAGLLKSHAEILRQLAALGGAGETPTTIRTSGLGKAPVSQLVGTSPQGGDVALSLVAGEGETMLAFLSSGCASCRTFWNELSPSSATPTPTTRVVAVTRGPQHESPSKITSLVNPGVPLVMSDDAWDEFRVPLTPHFVLVAGDGSILGEGSAASLNQLNALLTKAMHDSSPLRMSTEDRETYTDQTLRSAGIEPGSDELFDRRAER